MTRYYTYAQSPDGCLEMIEVTNLLDDEGKHTSRLDCAHAFVARLPNGGWLSDCICNYQIYRMH